MKGVSLKEARAIMDAWDNVFQTKEQEKGKTYGWELNKDPNHPNLFFPTKVPLGLDCDEVVYLGLPTTWS